MLAVERSHRPVEVVANDEPTVPIPIEPWVRPRVWADSDASRGGVPRCVSCGDAGQADPRCGGVVFCPDCLRRARDLTEWDDLGGGG